MKETGSFFFMNFFAISQENNYVFVNGGANQFFAVTHKPTSWFLSKFRK